MTTKKVNIYEDYIYQVLIDTWISYPEVNQSLIDMYLLAKKELNEISNILLKIKERYERERETNQDT